MVRSPLNSSQCHVAGQLNRRFIILLQHVRAEEARDGSEFAQLATDLTTNRALYGALDCFATGA